MWSRYPDAEFKRWDGEEVGAEESDHGGHERMSPKQLIKHGKDAQILECLDQFKDEEIIALLDRQACGPSVLMVIGQRSFWTRQPPIARLLCLNAKTPYHVTKTIVNRLGKTDLKEISRASNLPPNLVADARKQLAIRSRKGGR